MASGFSRKLCPSLREGMAPEEMRKYAALTFENLYFILLLIEYYKYESIKNYHRTNFYTATLVSLLGLALVRRLFLVKGVSSAWCAALYCIFIMLIHVWTLSSCAYDDLYTGSNFSLRTDRKRFRSSCNRLAGEVSICCTFRLFISFFCEGKAFFFL